MPALRRAKDAARLLLDLATRDPAFVRGGSLSAREIPVFTFHSLEPRSFERKLRYLLDAGYTTLSMGAYLDDFFGRAQASPQSVLITIDDGRATTWTVGYPILKTLGMRATAFLVTSAVHESDEVSKTIDNVSPETRGALIRRDESPERPFVTWGEVRAMCSVIDIESHTHLHARIPVGPEQNGVRSAAMGHGYGVFDSPFVRRDGRTIRGADVPLGEALPVSAPRLSGRPAYVAQEERYETGIEIENAIRLDLSEARRLIRARADAEATTVCYPWHVSSDIAMRVAREEGYVAGFAGKASGGHAISGPGSEPFQIARVGEDYVERLPGPGRRTLLSILKEKLRRR